MIVGLFITSIILALIAENMFKNYCVTKIESKKCQCGKKDKCL